MKKNLFKYPIGTVVNHEDEWGHVVGFEKDCFHEIVLIVKWDNGDTRSIGPEQVLTYNDL